ncbi:hypothetical protein BURMUCF2_A0741 [Burkholderia multivorans CF2]|nr:hypothetical protein BURMUCF2_A0741 [Burkholderia multivorans CF2]
MRGGIAGCAAAFPCGRARAAPRENRLRGNAAPAILDAADNTG